MFYLEKEQKIIFYPCCNRLGKQNLQENSKSRTHSPAHETSAPPSRVFFLAALGVFLWKGRIPWPCVACRLFCHFQYLYYILWHCIFCQWSNYLRLFCDWCLLTSVRINMPLVFYWLVREDSEITMLYARRWEPPLTALFNIQTRSKIRIRIKNGEWYHTQYNGNALYSEYNKEDPRSVK